MADKPFFMVENSGLIAAGPGADLLHPEANALVDDDSVTETQYFGFNVPEANVHGLSYIWHHPRLKTLFGGILAFEGDKPLHLAAELFDMRAYMSDAALGDDLHEFRLDNGYGVKILEPGKRFHITYADEARGNVVDLVSEGVTPQVMFGDGKHFEQGMKVTGRLVLRGREYAVDCYNVRDRSWGKPRAEVHAPLPPMNWMTCCVDESLIFNCSMFDHEGSQPGATGRFAMPVERALTGGWVWRDGLLSRVVSARKIVERDPRSLTARRISLDMQLEDGTALTAAGEMIASCPFTVWPNAQSNIALVRWNIEGRTGYGDSQDVIWHDYVCAMHQRQTT